LDTVKFGRGKKRERETPDLVRLHGRDDPPRSEKKKGLRRVQTATLYPVNESGKKREKKRNSPDSQERKKGRPTKQKERGLAPHRVSSF